ncbi:hypothetical protein BC829DRAFT_410474 [Chytridium lagenaria]|nr:hypothetical protein BC829DRAFT_410474 [Chytridium lagenaria]
MTSPSPHPSPPDSNAPPIISPPTSPPQPQPPNKWTPSAIILGIHLAQDGVVRALRSAKSRRPLLIALGYVAVTSLTLLGVGHGITWPLRSFTAMWVLDNVVGVVDAMMFWFLVMMPNAGLYFLRYMYPKPIDLVFFESLKTFTGEIALPGSRARFCLRFARSLETVPSGRVAYWLRLGILACVWLASKVPILGGLAWPAATFVYLSFHIGWKPAMWICGLGLISPPWGRFVQNRLLRNLLAFRALDRRQWFFKHEPVLAGFTLPFFLLLEIPVIGPALFFGLSQASAARVCLELFDDTDVVDGGPREQTVKSYSGAENVESGVMAAATSLLPVDSVARKTAEILDGWFSNVLGRFTKKEKEE